MNTHRITREWLKTHATSKHGGWNREQLAIIGVGWPMPPGWIGRIVGELITDEQRQKFESLSGRGLLQLENERKAPHRKQLAAEVYYTCPDGKGSWTGRWLEPHEIGTFPGPKL